MTGPCGGGGGCCRQCVNDPDSGSSYLADSEFVSQVGVPPTCHDDCTRDTCPRLRQAQDDVEMLLAKRTAQDRELVRLRALLAVRAPSPAARPRPPRGR